MKSAIWMRTMRTTRTMFIAASVGACALVTADSLPTTSVSAPNAQAMPRDYGFCTTCHGSQGNGNPAIRAPKIAGIEPWYLTRQFQHFRAGLRGMHADDVPGMEMRPVAEAMDDEGIAAVASYVGTLQPAPPPITVKGDAKQGRKLYEGCVACHGARAEGNSQLQAPKLAGQTDWYMVTQLEHFQSGMRGSSPDDLQGAQMRAAATALPSNAAIVDVVAYINTLRR